MKFYSIVIQEKDGEEKKQRLNIICIMLKRLCFQLKKKRENIFAKSKKIDKYPQLQNQYG